MALSLATNHFRAGQAAKNRASVEAIWNNKSMSEDVTVPALYECEPDSVPGPFYVAKGLCLICDLPCQTAPQNITWSKETFKVEMPQSQIVWHKEPPPPEYKDCPSHCRVEKQPETAEEIEQMIEAACGSCVQAIRDSILRNRPKDSRSFSRVG